MFAEKRDRVLQQLRHTISEFQSPALHGSRCDFAELQPADAGTESCLEPLLRIRPKGGTMLLFLRRGQVVILGTKDCDEAAAPQHAAVQARLQQGHGVLHHPPALLFANQLLSVQEHYKMVGPLQEAQPLALDG